MKTNICFLLHLLPILLVCQSNSSIDFITGIEYSNRVLHNTIEDSINNKILQLRKGETGKMNFRIGFNYNRRISQLLWLKTGLRLASIGYNGVKQDNLVWGSEIDPVTGKVTKDPNLPHDVQLIYDFWFIEIPLMLRREWNTNKLNPFFEIGLSPNIYLTTRTKEITSFYNQVIYQKYRGNFNTLNLSANLSFGLNYHLNEMFALFSQAIVRYHITPLADDPIKEYLYNIGIEIGIRKKIN